MYCTKCGVQLEDSHRFCHECGTPTGRGGAPVAHKPLLRSITNKKIAGVCGGFAEYIDADPIVVRLIWVVLTLGLPPAGLIGYIIAWIIIPKPEPVVYAPAPPMTATPPVA